MRKLFPLQVGLFVFMLYLTIYYFNLANAGNGAAVVVKKYLHHFLLIRSIVAVAEYSPFDPDRARKNFTIRKWEKG